MDKQTNHEVVSSQTRLAGVEDIEPIASVLMQGLNIDTIEEAVTSVQKEMAAGHGFLVHEVNGEVAGVVSYFRHGRPRHELAELEHIVVGTDFRGQGVATKMIRDLEVHLDALCVAGGFRLRKLFLLTHATNDIAHGLYRKLGFEHEATLPSHFYEDIDEFVFARYFKK